MTQQPPALDRVDPPYLDGERDAVRAWLDWHRATLLTKCAGLTARQLGERSVPPSSLSLRGLVRHMTDVERGWFRRVLDGQDAPDLYSSADDPDGDFDGVGRDADLAAAEAAVVRELAAFSDECTSSRRIGDTFDSLDDVGRGRTRSGGHQVSVRWVYLHMIEEYARHNGHADLLRERIDGVTGE